MPRDCGFMQEHYFAVQNEVGYAPMRREMERVVRSASRDAPFGPVRIPVVVHIVYNSASQNVTDQVVHEQIRVLNEDFRFQNADRVTIPEPFRELAGDARIEFELAKRDPSGNPTTGITRTQTSIARFPQAFVPPGGNRTQAINLELKVAGTGIAAWSPAHYLNIWVCNMGKNPLGYAAFPGSALWRDGVVIDYTCFGVGSSAVAPFNLGRTTTHEVGHYLDLLHIWGDDQFETDICSLSDNVGDTPNQGGPNYDVPTFPKLSCHNGPHGDLYCSYMDYVDDRAMTMFTLGQIARMQNALRLSRPGLLASPALQPANDARSASAHVASMLLRESPMWGRLDPASAEKISGLTANIPGTPTQFFDGVSWVRAGDLK